MPPSTKVFQMFPWVGGLNTAQDESVIPFNQLTKAENLVFGVNGSRKKREGINFDWDDQSSSTLKIIAGLDFWYGATTRTQRYLVVTDDKDIFAYTPSSGARSADLFAGTAWGSAVTTAWITALNNLAIITVDGSGNVPKKYNGSAVADLGVNVTTGNTTNTSNQVTSVASLVGVWPGVAVTGTGIPANTTVTNISGTTITISNNATATNTGTTLTFTTPGIPLASISREHLGRVWTNDKTRPDRLHYSATFDPEMFGGYGDSGALDIGVGDGDPDGITAIFPSFQGVLYVAKRTKLYKILGDSPENFQVRLVSGGIGAESHASATSIEDSDVVWCSSRGFHSVVTTDKFGDLESKFLSRDIQRTFNDKLVRSRLKHVKAGYINQLNSVAFACTQREYGATSNNVLYLYNVEQQAWYSWPRISCETLFVASDSDRIRAYLGTSTTRLAQTLTNVPYDVSESGTNTPVIMDVATGRISGEEGFLIEKGYKRLFLIFRPEGTFTLSTTFQVDDFTQQAGAFSQVTSTDLLGSTFILGSSLLGASPATSAYSIPIDGLGRGFKLRIRQTGLNEVAEIFGFAVEYEPASISQEVREG